MSTEKNVFKTLLRKTLQEQLYQQQVEWQFDEGLFIFIENGNEQKEFKTVNRKTDEGVIKENLTVFKRHESWRGGKGEPPHRSGNIYENPKKPDEPWYFKHRAFEAKIKKIENKWYLLILPEWFFSFDGFTKSNFHADDLKWLKRKANTEMVFNDFRFIHYFLENKGNNLLQDKNQNDFSNSVITLLLKMRRFFMMKHGIRLKKKRRKRKQMIQNLTKLQLIRFKQIFLMNYEISLY